MNYLTNLRTVFILLFTCSCMSLISSQNIKNQEIKDISQRISNLMKEWYIDKGKALELSEVILENYKEAKYDNAKNRHEFAKMLQSDLVKLSNDKHIQISYKNEQDTNENIRNSKEEQLEPGISKVRVLPGNIERIKITVFSPLEKKKFSEAFKKLKNSKAIIIDLRDCKGGAGDMVLWVMNHFLSSEPSLISTIENRKMNLKAEKWSLDSSKIPNSDRLSQPVYILVSSKTFSGGEAFAYHLKHSKRAIVVGEQTGGGANMVTKVQITNEENGDPTGSYNILLPYIKMLDGNTGKNWEGVGVIPNIKEVADDAMETAYDLAIKI